MKYRHEFLVPAPINVVSAFHSNSTSMAAITPPPVKVQIHSAKQKLGEGDVMDFTLWLGPLPIHWVANIEDVSLNGFTDRQTSGPFETWSHAHKYHQLDTGETLVVDEIQFRVKKHLLWGLVGLVMGLSLPLLFAYRGWKTRKLIREMSKQTSYLDQV